jgi:hypothetical protein
VLVSVVLIVVGTIRVVVFVTYLGKASKVTALVATIAMMQNRKAAKVLMLILSSPKPLHLTHCG